MVTIGEIQEVIYRSLTVRISEYDMQKLHMRNELDMSSDPAPDFVLTNFEWLLNIIENDWDEFRDDNMHSFEFSLDFMTAITPYLKRDDLDEIYFMPERE